MKVPPKPLGAEQLVARVQLVVDDAVVGAGPGARDVVRRLDADHAHQSRGRALHRSGRARVGDPGGPRREGRGRRRDRDAQARAAPRSSRPRPATRRRRTSCSGSSTSTTPTPARCKLKRDVSKLDEMALDTSSTKTTRVRLMSFTCPKGHASTTVDFCDVCGEPIAAAARRSGVAAPAGARPRPRRRRR